MKTAAEILENNLGDLFNVIIDGHVDKILNAMEEYTIQKLESTVAQYEIDRVNLVDVTLQRDELDEQYKNAIKDRNAWQSEYRAGRSEIERLKQRIDKHSEVIKEMTDRNRSQLMSVYYLLGAIKKMGTHREKETAVNFLQCTVEALVTTGDQLPWDHDRLPF